MGTKEIKPRMSIMKHIPLAPRRLSANFVLSFLAAKVRREICQGKGHSSRKGSTEIGGEFLPRIFENRMLCDAVDGILSNIPTVGTIN